MNVKILYSTDCAITIHFYKGHKLASAEWGGRFTNLQDAIDMGKYILRYIYPHSATGIVVWDSDTGEVLAEIEWDE
jgi:hypothetical protein